jgi:hypothetical protein
MARGDLAVFNDAKAYLIDGDFGSTDTIKMALITNAVVPTAADAVPGMNAGATTTYTEVTAGGAYTAGGETLDTLANMVLANTPSAGTMTFDDTGASVTWSQNASSPTDAYYAVVYNSDDTGLERAICYIDLGGPIDMTAGDLTVTWNASGIFTIT